MNLWIRNQDKSALVNVDEIRLSRGETCIGNNKSGTLGEYKSKERALEVLDEIQNLIIGDKVIEILNKTNGNMNNVYPTMFYQMPEK